MAILGQWLMVVFAQNKAVGKPVIANNEGVAVRLLVGGLRTILSCVCAIRYLSVHFGVRFSVLGAKLGSDMFFVGLRF